MALVFATRDRLGRALEVNAVGCGDVVLVVRDKHGEEHYVGLSVDQCAELATVLGKVVTRTLREAAG